MTTTATEETMFLAEALAKTGRWHVSIRGGRAVCSNPKTDRRDVSREAVESALLDAGFEPGMYEVATETDFLGRLRVLVWAEVG